MKTLLSAGCSRASYLSTASKASLVSCRHISSSSSPPPTFDVSVPKPKSEWKRQQGRQRFLDYLIVNIRAGKGGDGCVAFHREKFKPQGPPSGGNGGRGGSVTIRAVEGVTSLSGIGKRIRGANGPNGQGTWQHGKNSPDTVIEVPVGTVVREITDSRRGKTNEEAEQERLEGLSEEEKVNKRREMRWVHYPQYQDVNVGTEAFQKAEEAMLRAERAAEIEAAAAARRNALPLFLDLDEPSEEGHVVATGGQGGFGNPFFLSSTNRSPKFATRGREGERITLEFELKLLADIGLVGFPNAGKSTLLRALTNSRAEVAPYAFTTLNPQVGTVRVWRDGRFGSGETRAVEDSVEERRRREEELESGEVSRQGSRGFPVPRAPHDEVVRFTIADNPGLFARASENVGLGHSFLRSIERSLALAYVVDFSGAAPWDDLATLRAELEAYKPGLSRKARLVIANKADLLDAETEDQVREARAKLARLEAFVKDEMTPSDCDAEGYRTWEEVKALEVVPVSAKYRQNLEKVVRLLGSYVREAREEQHGRSEREALAPQPAVLYS